jgi:uncharacterized protein YllA (UPF0747 family)
MLSVITNIYNKQTKGPTLMELFSATGKCKKCLKAWIIAVVKSIDAPMLMRLWKKLEHCIDVCRVTHGAHITHL